MARVETNATVVLIRSGLLCCARRLQVLWAISGADTRYGVASGTVSVGDPSLTAGLDGRRLRPGNRIATPSDFRELLLCDQIPEYLIHAVVSGSGAWLRVPEFAQLAGYIAPLDPRGLSNDLQNAVTHALAAWCSESAQVSGNRLQQRFVIGQYRLNRSYHRVNLSANADEVLQLAFQLGSCQVAQTHCTGLRR